LLSLRISFCFHAKSAITQRRSPGLHAAFLTPVSLWEPLKSYCATKLLRWSVLEILMYCGVHSGFCAPSALLFDRSSHFFEAL
jgi:hypothetical protein